MTCAKAPAGIMGTSWSVTNAPEQDDDVLKEPTAETVLDAIRHITVSAQPQAPVESVSADPQILAA
jgi:hypothetical protein